MKKNELTEIDHLRAYIQFMGPLNTIPQDELLELWGINDVIAKAIRMGKKQKSMSNRESKKSKSFRGKRNASSEILISSKSVNGR
ncbi:hypothetical protein L0337_25475 [candidate division KSB1 bacterium]|nr:hypothetical protein [candidate division KSB1 bacterium]